MPSVSLPAAPRATRPDPDLTLAPTARRTREFEWPTWLLIGAVYGGWCIAVALRPGLGAVAGDLVLVVVLCWYMSLQHELLHGHPTRSRRINRWLGLLPLAVWYPYDLYRDSHLAHHRDEFLTDPGIDPESNYVEAPAFARMPGWLRRCRVLQRTVLGRVLIGPALVIVPTWADIVRRPLRGDFSQLRSWAQHLALLGLLLAVLGQHAGIAPWDYLACAYGALGLAMLRSFYEHRPAADPAHRVVINEASWAWRALYLNNNYHAVHHERPSLPWYRLRSAYLADRNGFLHRNGGFLVRGYGPLIARHALTPVDSPVVAARDA